MYMDEPLANIKRKIVFVDFLQLMLALCDEPSQTSKIHSGSFGSLRMETL